MEFGVQDREQRQQQQRKGPKNGNVDGDSVGEDGQVERFWLGGLHGLWPADGQSEGRSSSNSSKGREMDRQMDKLGVGWAEVDSEDDR